MCCNCLEHCLTLDGCSVNSSSSVRNLGVLFDSNLSFESHVSSICKTTFFHLKNISKLQPILWSMSNAERFIHAFMTSRLVYCKDLLGGCPACLINKLQLVLNAEARVLTRTRWGSCGIMVESRTHNRKVASLSLSLAGIVGGGSKCTALSPSSIPRQGALEQGLLCKFRSINSCPLLQVCVHCCVCALGW